MGKREGMEIESSPQFCVPTGFDDAELSKKAVTKLLTI
jgi:hypothetical protein